MKSSSLIVLVVLLLVVLLQAPPPIKAEESQNEIQSNQIDGGGGGVAMATESSSSVVKPNTICIPGLYTWGATSPRGDIKLSVGSTLIVNCTLDRSSPKVRNLTSSHLEFSFTKHDIPDSRLQVSIIDEDTAQLRVENMNVSTPLLYCSLIYPSHSNGDNTIATATAAVTKAPPKLLHICQNQINVGYPPLEVENFRCVARNWNSLNCSWTKPPNKANPIFTNYNLSYKLKIFSMECGRVGSYNGSYSCEWNGLTEPHYQPNYEWYQLVMNGSNVLAPGGVLWNYKVHHWSIMIPARPDKVEARSLAPNEVQVNWEFVNYELFKPGLLHRLTVCPQVQPLDCVTKNFTSHYKTGRLSERIPVPYAYMSYRVEVRSKSTMSNDTQEFWSEPTSATVQTLPKKPEFPPATTPGSFQLYNKYQVRDIFVYWQNIPPTAHNGSDFRLEFKVYEGGDALTGQGGKLLKGLRPSEVSSSVAVFSNMSMEGHRFEIYSHNSEGRSDQSAVVVVPPQGGGGAGARSPPPPLSVTKLFYSNGTYEVSWKPPPTLSTNTQFEIESYTIFICNGSRHAPTLCSVLLSWEQVPPTVTSAIYAHLPPHQVFQFGVSVNVKGGAGGQGGSSSFSSGMVLASCELVYNKVPGKITDVRIEAPPSPHTAPTVPAPTPTPSAKGVAPSSSTSLVVKWSLDCAYKPGSIEGFRLSYCRVTPTAPRGTATTLAPTSTATAHGGSAPTPTPSCTDPDDNKRELRVGAEVTETTLVDLSPFSKYLIAVSILTRAGESETSDPIYGTTAESAPSDPPTVQPVSTAGAITNTSALIAIVAPATPNGVLQKYKIIYRPMDIEGSGGGGATLGPPKEIEYKIGEGVKSDEMEVNLTGLVSNCNYSVEVSACTVSCSPPSPPAFLTTKMGATNLTLAPSIHYADETFVITWELPHRLGGPVQYFEVGVRRNGEPLGADAGARAQIPFKGGQSKYSHQVHLACETNTNLSVQVRAVSVIEVDSSGGVGAAPLSGGEMVLYGGWSPEGSLSCSGGLASWIIWCIALSILLFIALLVAFISKSFCKKFLAWKTFDISYPFEVELDGVGGGSGAGGGGSGGAHIKKMRQNSGGGSDTNSLGGRSSGDGSGGKENMIYKLYLASTDETKDFLPPGGGANNKEQQQLDTRGFNGHAGCQDTNNSHGSNSLFGDHDNNHNNEVHGNSSDMTIFPPLQESIDAVLKLNGVKLEDWSTSSSSSWQPASLFAVVNESTKKGDAVAIETCAAVPNNLSVQSSTVEDDYGDGSSPSPSKPLLSDSVHHYADEEEEEDDYMEAEQRDLDHYKKLGQRRQVDPEPHYKTPKQSGGGGAGPGSGGPLPGAGHSHSVGTPTPSPSSRSHSSHSNSSSSSSSTEESHTPLGAVSPAAPAGAGGPPGVVVDPASAKVPITTNNPYITWAYVKNEGEEGLPGQQPAYYQVGITMDTN